VGAGKDVEILGFEVRGYGIWDGGCGTWVLCMLGYG